jgi:UDP:flavonoid glycosyltransferase YjiC (YdhE family)
MGRRILLAWELGAGQGHRLMQEWVASALLKKGHDVILAGPESERAKGGESTSAAANIYAAPPWPSRLERLAFRKRPATSQADTLAAYGLAVPGAFEGLLRGWDELFRTIRPDVVVADSAPACLAAANGRIPAVAIGNGGTLPPFQLDRFPHLHPDEQPSTNLEEALLKSANEALTRTSRPPLQSLPELYKADRTCLGTFSELDPYAASRSKPIHAPWIPEWEGGAQMHREEIFGYLSVRTRRLETIVSALGRVAFAGPRVSVYIPNPSPRIAGLLAATKIRVEATPLSLKEIQARTRLIVSFGSLGLVSFALAAGIPQIVIPLSLTNRMTGKAIETLGTGRSLHINADNPLEPALLAQILQQSYLDADLTARAVSRAPDFIRRVFPRTAEVAASMVEELL